jgi:Mycobacterium membrane protein
MNKAARTLLVERHGWVYLFLAALWLVSGTYLITCRQVALPAPSRSPTPSGVSELSISAPKSVTYEVTSVRDRPVTVSYLDEQGQSRLYSGRAPWGTTLTTSNIGFAAGVTVLSADNTVTCRIKVDGSVTDEETDSGSHPMVSCNLLAFEKLGQ